MVHPSLARAEKNEINDLTYFPAKQERKGTE